MYRAIIHNVNNACGVGHILDARITTVMVELELTTCKHWVPGLLISLSTTTHLPSIPNPYSQNTCFTIKCPLKPGHTCEELNWSHHAWVKHHARYLLGAASCRKYATLDQYNFYGYSATSFTIHTGVPPIRTYCCSLPPLGGAT